VAPVLILRESVRVSEDPVKVPQLVLPCGTRIVTRREVRAETERAHRPVGSVAEIIALPADGLHRYRVRFSDGGEAAIRRRDFSILSQYKAEEAGLAHPGLEEDLRPYIVYRCVVGSRAYGLEGPGSDVDRRGFYVPPAEMHWSLHGVPPQLENPSTEECYWEVQKFLELALRANPNVLECLYTPLVEHATPLARELLALRSQFLSKLAYQTFNGYVLSQFKKLEQDLRAKGALKWKHVMHMIRLLLSGVALLRDGDLPVDVGPHRERLLSVRDGAIAWDEIEAWRHELHQELDQAYRVTRLPERPNYDAANAFLIKARRSALP
jgi:predicted nucleotidyltransferase